MTSELKDFIARPHDCVVSLRGNKQAAPKPPNRTEEFTEMYFPGLSLVLKDCEAIRKRSNDYDDQGFPRYIERLLKTLHKDGFWSKINHPRICAGREAYVYHATNRYGKELAIKIFTCPTIDLHFRIDCTAAEFKGQDIVFPHRTSNEFHTYDIMERTGILCPHPVRATGRVLIVEFIGKDGSPSPTLLQYHDQLSQAQLLECYKQMITIMRKLYQKAEYVHGDLNETNVLYHKDRLYLIDASQSLVTGHPCANRLLMKDCSSISKFFGAHNIPVMTALQLFRLVSDKCLTNESFDFILREIQLETMGIKRLPVKESMDALLHEEKIKLSQLKEEIAKKAEEISEIRKNLAKKEKEIARLNNKFHVLQEMVLGMAASRGC